MTTNRSGSELISRKIKTCEDDICSQLDDCIRSHRFSLSHLLSKCTMPKKEELLITHFTEFNSHGEFINTLQFLLPNLGREMLIYWNSKAGKSSVIDTETMFQDGNDEPDHNNDNEEENGTTMTHPTARNLSVEDEYLLVLMKLKMGLSEIDLGEMFSVTSSTANNVFLTWINHLYATLGSLKIWPHKDIILQNSPKEFLD